VQLASRGDTGPAIGSTERSRSAASRSACDPWMPTNSRAPNRRRSGRNDGTTRYPARIADRDATSLRRVRPSATNAAVAIDRVRRRREAVTTRRCEAPPDCGKDCLEPPSLPVARHKRQHDHRFSSRSPTSLNSGCSASSPARNGAPSSPSSSRSLILLTSGQRTAVATGSEHRHSRWGSAVSMHSLLVRRPSLSAVQRRAPATSGLELPSSERRFVNEV
jgi:hypothetical protein